MCYIAILLVIFALPYLNQIILLRKLRFNFQQSSLIEESDIGDFDRKILGLGLANLEELGFRKLYFRKRSVLELNGEIETIEAIAIKNFNNFDVLAVVKLYLIPTANNNPVYFEMMTFKSESNFFLTSEVPNVETTIENPNVISILYPMPLNELYTKHIERVENEKIDWRYNGDNFCLENSLNEITNSWISNLVSSNILVKAADKGYFLSAKSLVKQTISLKKQSDFRKKAKKYSLNDPENLASAPETYQRQISTLNILDDTPVYFTKKEMFFSFCLSALLAGLSFGILDNQAFFALTVLMVILVHEAGHALGMYLFGYKNIRFFFLPFFGGVALGKNQVSNPRGEVLMLLLGPLPGIMISAIIVLLLNYFPEINSSTKQLLNSYATLSLIINTFNLIPVMPLDGGKIMQILFFSRFPKLQFLFSIFSGTMLLLTFQPLLIVVGISIIMNSKTYLKSAKTAIQIKSNEIPVGQKFNHICNSFEHKSFKKMQPFKKLRLIQSVLKMSNSKSTGIVHSFVMLGIYLGGGVVVPTLTFLSFNQLVELDEEIKGVITAGIVPEAYFSEMKYEDGEKVIIGDISFENLKRHRNVGEV